MSDNKSKTNTKQTSLIKILSMVGMAIILVCCAFAFIGCKNNIKFDLNVYYYETAEGYGIAKSDFAGGDAFKGKVEIPRTHKGKPVTEISDFGGNRYEVEFILPDTLLYIRSGAFMYSHITTITIPKSVKLIEQPNSTFNGCELTEFIVEDGNSVYDSRNNCNGLIETATNKLILGINTTVIPQGVTAIGRYAYSAQNTTISSIVMPNSVTMIEGDAFSYCNNMTSIKLSDNLQSIGSGAFTNCYNLSSIYIPAGVVEISYNVFTGCTNLEIYCEVDSKPAGWNNNWTSKTVNWGVTYEQYLEEIN